VIEEDSVDKTNFDSKVNCLQKRELQATAYSYPGLRKRFHPQTLHARLIVQSRTWGSPKDPYDSPNPMTSRWEPHTVLFEGTGFFFYSFDKEQLIGAVPFAFLPYVHTERGEKSGLSLHIHHSGLTQNTQNDQLRSIVLFCFLFSLDEFSELIQLGFLLVFLKQAETRLLKTVESIAALDVRTDTWFCWKMTKYIEFVCSLILSFSDVALSGFLHIECMFTIGSIPTRSTLEG
jgi:hypothetical protein